MLMCKTDPDADPPRRGIGMLIVEKEPGVNKIGPSLAGIVGSKSGTVPGFNFSVGMKNADITWDDAELDKFLANPAGDVHGTKMFVNLPSESDRQNVIAYLHTLKK